MTTAKSKPGKTPHTRSVGRPRDRQVHNAILRATVEMLRAGGYSGLSIEGIARRAKVGKPAIYRRWSHVGLLVYEAVFSEDPTELTADCGTLIDDLRLFLRSVAAKLQRPEAIEALGGLLSEFRREERLQELIFQKWLIPVAEAFATVLRRAKRRGELAAMPPSELVLDALVGAVFFRSMMTRQRFDAADIEALIAILDRGLKATNKRT